MSWLLPLLLAVVCLVPLALTLLRPARPRGRQEADLALYQAQRAELDGQLAEGRLDQGSHASALLEVQHRILSAPRDRGWREGRGGTVVLLSLPLLIALGLGLYLWHGKPGLPSATFAERTADAARAEALLGDLRARIESLDPKSAQARQGWLLLGNAERSRGNLAAAVEAWEKAQAVRFDPVLAGDIAELQLEGNQVDAAAATLKGAGAATADDLRLRYLAGAAEIRAGRNAAGKAIWQAMLSAAPADAPWRAGLEQQLRDTPG
ncbi:c-type cytochrome biogenesis protein CcmI [Roseomonas elaeocarpi]|uniref:C-type cytochrome biogenesis protein CcmI n=1 Tax=Roseomonas elaeocarpi TaxID=907779 RepID=A0ABV6JPN8_9PROT